MVSCDYVHIVIVIQVDGLLSDLFLVLLSPGSQVALTNNTKPVYIQKLQESPPTDKMVQGKIMVHCISSLLKHV